MQVIRDGVALGYDVTGPDDGAPVVFANALGTTLAIWDQVAALLPAGLRIIRYYMRGHGASDAPDGPYSMGQLVSDAEAVCDAAGVRDALFIGLSVGGMVAQGLAVKRPDLIRALVLSNTAAKIGNPKLWQDRIDTVRAKGLTALSDAVLQRWFARGVLWHPRDAAMARDAGKHAGRGLYRHLCGHCRHRFLYHDRGLAYPDAGDCGN